MADHTWYGMAKAIAGYCKEAWKEMRSFSGAGFSSMLHKMVMMWMFMRSSQPQDPNLTENAVPCHREKLINYPEIEEEILALLPIGSIVRVQSVDKRWRSLVSASDFRWRYDEARPRKSWLFMQCTSWSSTFKRKTFALDLEERKWYVVPNLSPPGLGHDVSLATSADGMSYITTRLRGKTQVWYSRNLLHNAWMTTTPMTIARHEPLICSFSRDEGLHLRDANSMEYNLLAVGGFSAESGQPQRAVELYDPLLKRWEVKACLPEQFRGPISRLSMTGVALKGKFYLLHKHSTCLAIFDLERETWGRILQPSLISPPAANIRPRIEIDKANLVICEDMLFVVGVCNSFPFGVFFKIWVLTDAIVRENQAVCKEVATMPKSMFRIFTGGDEAAHPSRMDCVSSGSTVYVYSMNPKRGDRNVNIAQEYRVVAWTISRDKLVYQWSVLPALPTKMDGFDIDRIGAFISPVSLQSIFN